jgi:hypothetical protein
MHRFVVRIGLRQYVPLCAGIEDPQNRRKDYSRGDRFTSGAAFGNVFLGKMLSDPLPMSVTQFYLVPYDTRFLILRYVLVRYYA